MSEPISGLSVVFATELKKKWGPNRIEEKKRSFLSRLVGWVVTPMSLMFVVAGGLSVWAGNDSSAIIIALLFLTNIGVGAWHEAKADTAIEKLKEKLSVIVRVNRDGVWTRLPSEELVPGDVVELSTGDLIPADVSFIEAKNVSVNEGVVTGESLPKEKSVGDGGYSGSFLTTGFAVARVTATGSHTYFGKTLTLVEGDRRQSQLEKDILSISKFLSIVSVIIMASMTVVLVVAREPILEIATLDISMLIAGIPVALPTVMTLIISVGVVELARKSVIVRRLSSLEDLANVNLLLSDKTGTLTENHITVARMVALDDGEVVSGDTIDGHISENDIWSMALAAAPETDTNPLVAALREHGKELGLSAAPVVDFIPGDSERKRATAFLEKGKEVVNGKNDDDKKIAISLGASQTIKNLCAMDDSLRAKYDALVDTASGEGFRVLALAISPTEKEENMRPLALFFLADAIRPDARETIDFMHDYGIEVKMVTGDDYGVAVHIAKELGLDGRIVRRSELEETTRASENSSELVSQFSSIAGFAEVLPKEKYDIVVMAQHISQHISRHTAQHANQHTTAPTTPYVVAVTGDGVNDVPPVKTANVGIAVSNAVDALKGTADIVLVQPGISVIKDAIIESRKIFVRLYNYSVYRISESFRLIVTIAVIGVLFHTFPLTPVQIILIALLNDVPIISLAFDRVAVSRSPASINVRRRLTLSLLYGTTGIVNSLLLLWIAISVFHAPWIVIQTLFFLKLTVSGHMLVYVAHTEKPWYRFLPSKQVLWATSITQVVATALSLLGIFVAPISVMYVVFVWVWAFIWMQISEVVKQVFERAEKTIHENNKMV